eukprot:8811115-Pyramimonas_sp.AAC.1
MVESVCWWISPARLTRSVDVACCDLTGWQASPRYSLVMARAARCRRERHAPTEGTRRTSKNTRVCLYSALTFYEHVSAE